MKMAIFIGISIAISGCATTQPPADVQAFMLDGLQIMQDHYNRKAEIAQQRQIQSQQPVYQPSQSPYIQQGKCYQDAFANVRCY